MARKPTVRIVVATRAPRNAAVRTGLDVASLPTPLVLITGTVVVVAFLPPLCCFGVEELAAIYEALVSAPLERRFRHSGRINLDLRHRS